MDMINILIDVKKLLTDDACWVQNTLAVNSEYERVNPEDEEACAWCLQGAVEYVVHINTMTHEHVSNTLLYIQSKLGLYGSSIPNFNDHDETSHNDLMIFLDKIIAEYPQRGTT